MPIALFPSILLMLVYIAIVLAGTLLLEYPLSQATASFSQSPLLPPSLPPPKQTLSSNFLSHISLSNNITNTTSNTINGTTICNLQSHQLNSVFKEAQNSVVQLTS